MTDVVAHATLTGADLHEPKGVSSAASGTVYLANGSGGGSWSTIATALNFVGVIVPVITPIAPTGFLELDGSSISRTTYSDLFSAVTIQQTGTRSSGSAIITGLSSTTNMKVGYYVGGSGITNGSVIVSVDSSTQITIDNNASSSGSATVIVSPWALGDGSTTYTLPDATTNGMFFRSRTSSIAMGVSQTSANLAHTHTTDSQGSHTHTGTTDSDGDHLHTYTKVKSGGGTYVGGAPALSLTETDDTSTAGAHTHSFTTDSDGAHTHTAQSSGGTEARPYNITVMWCVKY